LYRSKNRVLRRAAANVENAADLLDRPALKMSEHKRRSLDWRQLRHCGRYSRFHFGTQHAPFWRRVRRWNLQLKLLALGIHSTQWLRWLSLRDQVKRAIDGNPAEPRTEIRPRLETANRLVSPHKRFLHNFLSVLFVPNHAKRNSKDGPAMALDERPEGIAVARLHLPDVSHILRLHASP